MYQMLYRLLLLGSEWTQVNLLDRLEGVHRSSIQVSAMLVRLGIQN